MIAIKNLSASLGSFRLEDVGLSVVRGEYFVVLGPTGAGKTVLLECIAGLHRIRRGEIWIDGRNVTHLAPEDRQVGYVPQDYVLFPFLNVFGNIAFGLKQTRRSQSEIKKRVDTVAHLMGILHLLNRAPRSLSGGEKQRVALARALAPSPNLLLLDEPLSSLDLQTSKYLRLELRRIHDELGITTVHVTHNQMEAEEIADRIAVLNQGRLEQVGRPDEIFFYPKNEFVSEFIGTPNILDCDFCRSLGHGLLEVHCGGIVLIIPHDGNSVHRIALFPRDIYISKAVPPGPEVNRVRGVISETRVSPTSVRLTVEVGETRLLTEMPPHIFESMGLEVGQEVFLILKLRRIKVYENRGVG